MQTKFQRASALERQKMSELLSKYKITDYSFTDDNGYDEYDGTYINPFGEDVAFEIKNRNVSSTKYPTTIIEESKYNFLITQSIGIPMLYVFFNDGTYFYEELNAAKNYNKVVMGAPSTTMGDDTWVSKTFIEIPIDSSKIHIL